MVDLHTVIVTNQGNSIKGTQWVLGAGETSAADRSSHDLCADHYFPCKNQTTNLKVINQIYSMVCSTFYVERPGLALIPVRLMYKMDKNGD